MTQTVLPGTYAAVVPHRRMFYPLELRERWGPTWLAWLASGRRDRSVWKEFQPLLDTPGFRFHHWEDGRFAECVVALDLLQQGYSVFLAPKLFPSGKALGTSRQVTELVEARLAAAGLPLPCTVARRVEPKLRNPDVAAQHMDGHWRFCEAKRNTDRPQKGQVEALGVLQLLLDATVEVVRVVPIHEQARPEPRAYRCSYSVA